MEFSKIKKIIQWLTFLAIASSLTAFSKCDFSLKNVAHITRRSTSESALSSEAISCTASMSSYLNKIQNTNTVHHSKQVMRKFKIINSNIQITVDSQSAIF